MIRRMFILGALALVALAPAAHAQYGGASVSDSTVTRGDTVTVTAIDCPAGSTVDFFLDGSPLGSAVADAGGTASADVVIDTTDGTHQITNSCNDAVLSITVSRPGGPGAAGVVRGPGALPRTGTDSSLPLTKIAVVLIAAGGLLIVVARDRSKKTATTA